MRYAAAGRSTASVDRGRDGRRGDHADAAFGTSSSFSALASSTITRAVRTSPAGARDEIRAPISTPGIEPTRTAAAMSSVQVAEEGVAERGRGDQRDRLDQVGADQVVGAQLRVQREQRHDDQ